MQDPGDRHNVRRIRLKKCQRTVQQKPCHQNSLHRSGAEIEPNYHCEGVIQCQGREREREDSKGKDHFIDRKSGTNTGQKTKSDPLLEKTQERDKNSETLLKEFKKMESKKGEGDELRKHEKIQPEIMLPT
jgi:hypothetical protein